VIKHLLDLTAEVSAPMFDRVQAVEQRVRDRVLNGFDNQTARRGERKALIMAANGDGRLTPAEKDRILVYVATGGHSKDARKAAIV
jgi:hypothetical protein